MRHKPPKYTHPTLGYFLTYKLWRDACEVLEYQLGMKKNNKHFNTLSMFFYEGLSGRPITFSKKYFRKRVSNNLFYGLENEFAIVHYPIPKSKLGLRNYKFLTYPLRLVYYAVGLYLVKISQEFIKTYYHQYVNVSSYYGGDLHFNNSTDRLVLSYESFWYKPHYKEFRQLVKDILDSEDVNRTVVLQIDIQNYFDNLDIDNLLNKLSEMIKPSIQKMLKFDAITRSQISAFFGFLNNGKSGIPQADNDILSTYIGHLYLVFADIYIEQILALCSDFSSYKIYRYMDDMFISLVLKEGLSPARRETAVNNVSVSVSDMFYERLDLRLNDKTRFYKLDQEEDRKALSKALKKVSLTYDCDGGTAKKNPQITVDRILAELTKLKLKSLDIFLADDVEFDPDVLKEIYANGTRGNPVVQLFRKAENAERLHNIFSDFNFDLVAAQPREITILILLDEDAKKNYEKYLLAKKGLNSREVLLVLTYLNQTKHKSRRLRKHLSTSTTFAEIAEILDKNSLNTNLPGYYSLQAKQILRLRKMANVIEQIRLRVNSEAKGEYSVALSHLLNEVHVICLQLDNEARKREDRISKKEYNVHNTIAYLCDQEVPHETCIRIRNLFDRRNKTPVSHADPIAWPVERYEYLEYREHVGVALKIIL